MITKRETWTKMSLTSGQSKTDETNSITSIKSEVTWQQQKHHEKHKQSEIGVLFLYWVPRDREDGGQQRPGRQVSVGGRLDLGGDIGQQLGDVALGLRPSEWETMTSMIGCFYCSRCRNRWTTLPTRCNNTQEAIEAVWIFDHWRSGSQN